MHKSCFLKHDSGWTWRRGRWVWVCVNLLDPVWRPKAGLRMEIQRNRDWKAATHFHRLVCVCVFMRVCVWYRGDKSVILSHTGGGGGGGVRLSSLGGKQTFITGTLTCSLCKHRTACVPSHSQGHAPVCGRPSLQLSNFSISVRRSFGQPLKGRPRL